MTEEQILKAADEYAEMADLVKQTTAVQDFIAGAKWMQQQLKQASVIVSVCEPKKPKCRHPKKCLEPYHDGAIYCTKCEHLISQFGRKFDKPVRP